MILIAVDTVYLDRGKPEQRAILRVVPNALSDYGFSDGLMGPKAEAAGTFARTTDGVSFIGNLENAVEMLRGEAGTTVSSYRRATEFAQGSELLSRATG